MTALSSVSFACALGALVMPVVDVLAVPVSGDAAYSAQGRQEGVPEPTYAFAGVTTGAITVDTIGASERGDHETPATYDVAVQIAVQEQAPEVISPDFAAAMSELDSRRWRKAIDSFGELEVNAENDGNVGLAAKCAIHLATAQRELRLYDDAIAAAERAKQRCLSIGDQGGVAQGIREIALTISYDRRHRESLPLFRQAVDGYERAGSCEREIAIALWDTGVALSMLGDHSAAIEAFEDAERRFRLLGADKQVAGVVASRAITVADQGRAGQAQALFDEALETCRSMPDAWWEYGTTLVSKARALSRMRERAAAIGVLADSVRWFREAASPVDAAEALHSLGITQSQARMRDLALDSFDEALAEIAGLPDTDFLRGDILHSKALTLSRIKRYTEALNVFDQAAQSYQRAPFADIEYASSLRSKAITHSYAGQSEKAISTVQEAAGRLSSSQRYRELIPIELARCDRSLGIEYSKCGQTDRALGRFEKGLARIKEVAHSEGLSAGLLESSGITLVHAGRGHEARAKFIEAVEVLEGVPGTDPQKADILARLVRQCNLLGLTSEADRYEQQLARIQEAAQ